ncbi:MAG TPA: HAMP domain-containing sensor histidine kinase, partial [Polyangiaceae bacterium]|nr:HAMP domain-containing sensor histidine kinase [Polyangiaceae bacterium]
PSLAAAHLRLGRAAVGIYVAASAVALSLLGAFLFTENSHTQAELRRQVMIQSADRAHALQNHLELLTRELRRLGLRSEVDLFDQNLEPERSLLGVSHGSSTFFNLGVAILGVDGAVVWAEPKRFLPVGQGFADEPWFAGLSRSRTLRVVAVEPERAEDATLYVVSPIVRSHQFQGAILGGIDLASSHVLSIEDRSLAGATTILATADGQVVFPGKPPAFAGSEAWNRVFSRRSRENRVTYFNVEGRTQVLGIAPLDGSDLDLLLLIDEATLFHDSSERLRTRLLVGLALAVLPLLALVVLLRHSLRIFREGEEQAMREERLQRIGEAANLIAHEVKNSLNGIRMAAELACGPPEPRSRAERALTELRGEIERLTNFTGDLMTFSKGIQPRPVRLDLNELAEKLFSLFEAQAAEAGVELLVRPASAPTWVLADPQLLRVGVSNLINNALDALSTRRSSSDPPRIEILVEATSGVAKLLVADNGDGVSVEVRPRLFEPFQSGKTSGVGIGLALSKRIALAHHGDLALSPSSHGATFVLSLPLERA